MANSSKNKQVVKTPKISDNKKRKKPQYKSFRLQKRIKHPAKKLPNWWQLLKKSLLLMKVNLKPIAVFFVVYATLSILLVRGFGSVVNVNEIQTVLEETVGINESSVESGLTTFGLLLSEGTQSATELGQLYQLILLVVACLAIIWLYRQQQAGNNVTMKTAFYRGMYPLIPFVLVVLVIGLQLIPAAIGNFLFATVTSNGLVVGAFEQIIWLLLFLSTLLLSLYMVSSSVIALFIVTLPEMTPMRALREARELVRHRRFSVLRKVLMIVLICFAALFIFVLPVIFIAPAVAEWLFFALTVIAVPFVVGYLFSLYRELL